MRPITTTDPRRFRIAVVLAIALLAPPLPAGAADRSIAAGRGFAVRSRLTLHRLFVRKRRLRTRRCDRTLNERYHPSRDCNASRVYRRRHR